jgi:hypothetical protein
MTKAEYAAKKASDNIVGALKVVGTAVAGMISIGALDAAFKSITDMESALLKTANRLNTNVETLSSFSVMARKTGMDADSFYMALTRMEKGLSAAALGAETATGKFDENGEEILKTSKTYDELGLKANVLLKLPLDQQLLAIATAMKENIAPADQVRIAMELFGRGGAGMVNVFKEGPEAMQKWIDRAKELGIITDDMAKRGAEAKTAAGDLSLAWSNFARELVDAVAPAITAVTNKLTDLIVASRKSSEGLNQAMALGGQGLQQYTSPQEGAETFYGTAAIIKETQKAPILPGAKTKGAGSKDTGLDRMQSIIDTLQKDLSRLTEGSLAEINAWATKTISEIEKVGRKGAETETALALVAQVQSAKKQKATEDYNLFVAKSSGNVFAEIEAQGKADLEKYKGFEGAKGVIAAEVARKTWEQQVKNYSDVLNLQKNLYDSLASLTPIVEEQNLLRKKSLDIEIEMNKYAQALKLTELERAGIITKAQADEFKGLQAIEAQAKKTNLAMEQDQGLTGWAYDRNKSIGQQSTIKNMMSGAEGFITNAFSSGIQGILSKDKTKLHDIGKTMFQGFLGEIQKGSITKSFDALAKIISPPKSVTGENDPARSLNMAGKVLSGAGLQLATSAGGLLLSGIGIMTNSQALVYAGTVLQVAGLAIQLYEALSATTTAVTMTTAGAALTTSAISLGVAAEMLIIAAAVDSIPFFHQGGIITAHGGWPLRPDERLIKAQVGERVLSRRQNRDYERGLTGSAGGSVINAPINVTIHPRQEMTQADYDRHSRMIVKSLNKELGLHGKAPLGPSYG